MTISYRTHQFSSVHGRSSSRVARRASSGAVLLFSAFSVLGADSADAAPSPERACDLDCTHGFTCQLVACPEPYCVEGASDCPVCDGPVPMCAPAACASDKDCSAEMRCAEQTQYACSVPAPAPAPSGGGAGDPGAQLPAPECAPVDVLQCTPRSQLPCSVDADCGTGFSCADRETCEVLPSEPGSDGPVEITCHPSGTLACAPVKIACDTHADCPAAHDCVENPYDRCATNGLPSDCEPGLPPLLCLPRPITVPPAGTTETAAAPGGIGAAESSARPGDLSSTLDAVGVAASAEGEGCSLGTRHAERGWLSALSMMSLFAAWGGRRKR